MLLLFQKLLKLAYLSLLLRTQIGSLLCNVAVGAHLLTLDAKLAFKLLQVDLIDNFDLGARRRSLLDNIWVGNLTTGLLALLQGVDELL